MCTSSIIYFYKLNLRDLKSQPSYLNMYRYVIIGFAFFINITRPTLKYTTVIVLFKSEYLMILTQTKKNAYAITRSRVSCLTTRYSINCTISGDFSCNFDDGSLYRIANTMPKLHHPNCGKTAWFIIFFCCENRTVMAYRILQRLSPGPRVEKGSSRFWKDKFYFSDKTL